MIKYNRFTLDNGLRVIHQEDKTISTVVVNTLYNVGARDESTDKTGFAHLFEHLMFAGSKNVPSFDEEIEKAGGSNNAFTNNEYTNYYISVPAENIETAFWLESDRMLELNINEESLSVQKGVVIEEFKQRCYSAPFGLLWHHVRDMLYTKSPYRWPSIGLDFEHISNASLQDVRSFYNSFYTPNNAILSVVGNIDLNSCKTLSEKWFSDIPQKSESNKNHYEKDSKPRLKHKEEEDLSPNPVVFLVWKWPAAKNDNATSLELFADMLGGSEVSDLYETLVKQENHCNVAECFYIKGIDEGLFVVYGILNEGVDKKTVENRLWEVCETALNKGEEYRFAFESAQNKAYTQLLFEPINPTQRAHKLAFYELLDKPEEVNQEAARVRSCTLEETLKTAKKELIRENASVLYYNPKEN